jgi:hypothetical protein
VDILSQVDDMKTTGILCVFRGFQGEELGQKIQRFTKIELSGRLYTKKAT